MLDVSKSSTRQVMHLVPWRLKHTKRYQQHCSSYRINSGPLGMWTVVNIRNFCTLSFISCISICISTRDQQ